MFNICPFADCGSVYFVCHFTDVATLSTRKDICIDYLCECICTLSASVYLLIEVTICEIEFMLLLVGHEVLCV